MLALSLHSGNPHSLSPLSHSVCPLVLFCSWFFHSLLCVQLAILFCFGLTVRKKKTTNWNHIGLKNVYHRSWDPECFQTQSPHCGRHLPTSVQIRTCSRRDAHSLINVFKLRACGILEDVFHNALQSQLAFLSRQIHHWKAN